MATKCILLVNENLTLMDITKRILERAGYSVCCAAGVHDTLERLNESIPDIVVLGRELSDGNGFDLCKTLRSDYTFPIMFVSSDKDDEIPALWAGANDYLKKPFDYNVFKARICVLISFGIQARRRYDDIESCDDVISSHDFSLDEDGSGELVTECPHCDEIDAQSGAAIVRLTPFNRFSFITTAVLVLAAAILIGVFVSIRSTISLTGLNDSSIPLAEHIAPE